MPWKWTSLLSLHGSAAKRALRTLIWEHHVETFKWAKYFTGRNKMLFPLNETTVSAAWAGTTTSNVWFWIAWLTPQCLPWECWQTWIGFVGLDRLISEHPQSWFSSIHLHETTLEAADVFLILSTQSKACFCRPGKVAGLGCSLCLSLWCLWDICGLWLLVWGCRPQLPWRQISAEQHQEEKTAAVREAKLL